MANLGGQQASSLLNIPPLQGIGFWDGQSYGPRCGRHQEPNNGHFQGIVPWLAGAGTQANPHLGGGGGPTLGRHKPPPPGVGKKEPGASTKPHQAPPSVSGGSEEEDPLLDVPDAAGEGAATPPPYASSASDLSSGELPGVSPGRPSPPPCLPGTALLLGIGHTPPGSCLSATVAEACPHRPHVAPSPPSRALRQAGQDGGGAPPAVRFRRPPASRPAPAAAEEAPVCQPVPAPPPGSGGPGRARPAAVQVLQAGAARPGRCDCRPVGSSRLHMLTSTQYLCSTA